MLIESALAFAQLVASQPAIGLASTDGRGGACVAMSAAPGSVVTLVAAGTSSPTVTATIEGSVTACSLSEHSVDGPYLRLRLRRPVADRAVWVAFQGDLTSNAASRGRVTVRLSAALPDVQVHECLSSEGVHYSAWAGEALKSRRLWHKYYYLGYDAEPTCTQRSEVDP